MLICKCPCFGNDFLFANPDSKFLMLNYKVAECMKRSGYLR